MLRRGTGANPDTYQDYETKCTIDRILFMQPSPYFDGDFMMVKWKGLPWDKATLESARLLPAVRGYFEAKRVFEWANLDPLERPKRVGEGTEPASGELPVHICSRPRKEQVFALEWMMLRWQHGLDFIINGEVDLKSEKEGALFVTSVCIQQESAPVLIVVPHKSDVVLWTEELLSVCPEIVVVQYIGGDREQELIRTHALLLNSESDEPKIKFDVLLTTVDVMHLPEETARFARIPWQSVILDEGEFVWRGGKARKSSKQFRCLDNASIKKFESSGFYKILDETGARGGNRVYVLRSPLNVATDARKKSIAQVLRFRKEATDRRLNQMSLHKRQKEGEHPGFDFDDDSQKDGNGNGNDKGKGKSKGKGPATNGFALKSMLDQTEGGSGGGGSGGGSAGAATSAADSNSAGPADEGGSASEQDQSGSEDSGDDGEFINERTLNHGTFRQFNEPSPPSSPGKEAETRCKAALDARCLFANGRTCDRHCPEGLYWKRMEGIMKNKFKRNVSADGIKPVVTDRQPMSTTLFDMLKPKEEQVPMDQGDEDDDDVDGAADDTDDGKKARPLGAEAADGDGNGGSADGAAAMQQTAD